METPQEIEVKFVLPVLRRELAKALIASGLSQKDAAKKLGVTEAAVSQYIKKKRGALAVKMPASEIKKSAKSIINGGKMGAMKEISRLCGVIRKTKILCCVHKKYGNPMKRGSVCLK